MTKIILPSEPKKDGGDLLPIGGLKPQQTVEEDIAPSIYEDLSVDEELKKGLLAINRLMKQILTEIRFGEIASRDLVANLKACMDMLRDLKKSEKEMLENLDDAELERLKEEQSAD